MPDRQVVALVSGYGERTAAVRRRVERFIRLAWGSLESWREADIARFVRAVVPVVEGGQVQIAALTDAYLAAVHQGMTGTPARPVGVAANLVNDEAMRGVSTAEVYSRSGPEVWSALDKGHSVTAAVTAGLRRAQTMAATDLQLAKTHASRHVLGRRDGVVGFRRVLTGRRSCALCGIASTQRYRHEDLMPIHPQCDCSVAPIVGDRDPGQVIDPDTLDSVHQSVEDRLGVSDPSGRTVDYRQLVVVHEHGEIGPVLAVKGQTFTGPDDLS